MVNKDQLYNEYKKKALIEKVKSLSQCIISKAKENKDNILILIQITIRILELIDTN